MICITWRPESGAVRRRANCDLHLEHQISGCHHGRRQIELHGPPPLKSSINVAPSSIPIAGLPREEGKQGTTAVSGLFGSAMSMRDLGIDFFFRNNISRNR